jgi:DNA polymerase-3 subunit gamma/tau
MSQALYRKYRSTSFDELVGQEHVTELLKAAVKNGTFSHAYLFTGQRGTGKTSAARILAYAINELPYDADAGHLDIIEIDAASNRRIDDIRDLREKVFIAPVSAKYKVYIIDEVHMLTGESFNALLKTIEEPPAHAVFILATTELHKVPATIISRTQRFHFRPVALEKVVEHLKMIAKKEKIDIDDEALKLIAEHGGGSFRDSISLLDQLGSLEGKVTADTVESILGRARSHDIATVLQLLKEHKQADLHALLNDMMSQGISPVTLSEQLVAALLHETEASTETYELGEKLMAVPKAHFPQLLLMTTLLGSIAVPEKPQTKTTPEKPAAALKVSDSKHEVIAKHIVEESSSEPEQQLSAEKKNEDTVGRKESQNTGEFNWEAVLAATKKTNPALHSVLSRAEMRLDGTNLHLGFQYALHRKKLEQAEYRTQLLRVIQDVCSMSVELHLESAGAQIANDESAKKVADLMGGGERVTV